MQYDLIIVGWGAAGFSAAIRASEITGEEMKIALIGKGNIGGTCVNVGCIPSKFLIEKSLRINDILYNSNGVSKAELFSEVMKELKNTVYKSRVGKYEDVIKNYKNVDLYYGEASFLDNRNIQVKNANNTHILRGSYIIISTGSSPTIPPFANLNDIKTSDNFWDIEVLPEKLAIIGGGPIGLEIGQAMRRFGTEVSIFEIANEILPGYSEEIQSAARNIMQYDGIQIHTDTKIDNITSENSKCIFYGNNKECFDEILIATGRYPNTATLNLQAAGVQTDSKGFIITDRKMKTSSEGIFAAGDCVSGKLKLETLSAREGVIAVENIFGYGKEIDLNATPWAIFTTPNIAGVGISEHDAIQKGLLFDKRVIDASSAIRNSISGNKYGFAKILIERTNRKILGIEVISPEAADFIVEGVYALRFGLTVDDIIDSTHIFPSHSEIIKMAAQSFKRDINKMSCCME